MTERIRVVVAALCFMLLGFIGIGTTYILTGNCDQTKLFTDMAAARDFHNKCKQSGGKIHRVRPYTYGTEITCRGARDDLIH